MKSSQKNQVCLTEKEAPLLNGVVRYGITLSSYHPRIMVETQLAPSVLGNAYVEPALVEAQIGEKIQFE